MGDLTTTRISDQNCSLMHTLAAQARNPYWKWYVDMHPEKVKEETRERRLDAVGAGRSLYIDFVRGALPEVRAKAPVDCLLPMFSRYGVGGDEFGLTDGKNNVSVILRAAHWGRKVTVLTRKIRFRYLLLASGC